jgi:hypothetical protein
VKITTWVTRNKSKTNKLAHNKAAKGGKAGQQRWTPRVDSGWLHIELAKVQY